MFISADKKQKLTATVAIFQFLCYTWNMKKESKKEDEQP